MQNSAKLNLELNMKDKGGRTAFHLACIYGSFRIAELLLQKSADFDIDANISVVRG